MSELIDIFENKELNVVFMSRAIQQCINDYKKQCEKYESELDYIKCEAKNVIYKHNDSYLSIVCRNKFMIDLEYHYENDNQFDFYYNIKLSTHNITRDVNMENIVHLFINIYNDIYENNPTLECCKNCQQPYRDKNKKSKLFNNYCEDCDASVFFILKKYTRNNSECNICYTSILEKTENDKITDTKMLRVLCCKDKYICEDCKNKLHKECECNCGQCEEVKCPFCKKILELKSL